MTNCNTGHSVDRKNACSLCHSSIAFSVPEFEGYRICRTCDLTWCTEDDPSNLTSDWEKQYYGREDVFKLHEARRSGIEAIMARLNAVCPDRGRLLDVGTGVGLLMRVAAQAGWSVEGVEPSKRAAESARELTGATVYNDLLENLTLTDKHYDAITILDTLRFVPDPLAFLQAARKLLRPGGMLLVRDVNRELLRRTKWLLNRSLEMKRRRKAFEQAQWFSPKSLIYALQALGLQGWLEPSPVFVEPISAGGLMGSLLKRMIGLTSSMIYEVSAQRIIISPNLLAFGRAPSEMTSTIWTNGSKALHSL